MKFTRIPTATFENLQLNAGILLSTFNPTTGAVVESNIIGATAEGINFVAAPTYSDYGEDIDNCPKNMKELKRLESWEAKMSGNFITVTAATAKLLTAAADLATNKITPRNSLKTADFSDIWWVGDYSEYNGDTNGGFVAIHLINGLNTGGFSIQSTDKGKGRFAFEFTAHYSMSAQDTVPFEIYVKDGSAETEPTYSPATLTSAGFKYGTTYYTRSGSAGAYVHTEVSSGTVYDSSTTYYTKDE